MLNFDKQLSSTPGKNDARTIERLCLYGLIFTVILISCSVLPWVDHPIAKIPAMIPFYIAGVVVTDAAAASLLFVQFHQNRTWPIILLGSACLYNAVISVPFLFSFPGGLVAEGALLGDRQTVGWLWSLWHFGFPALVLIATTIQIMWPNAKVAHDQTFRVIWWAVGSVIAAIIGIVILSTVGQDLLPFQNVNEKWPAIAYIFGGGGAAMAVITLLIIWRFRLHLSILYLWFAVVMVSFLFDIILNLLSGQRYTVGWYASRVCSFFSGAFLLAMFLIEINRLYLLVAAANRTLEHRVAERTTELQASNGKLTAALAEKDVLLREVYHRVKNNLQMVDTFVALQANQHPETEPGLSDLRRRINSLGLVHQQLMQSSDLATFKVDMFIEELCQNLRTSYAERNRDVMLVSCSDTNFIDLDFAIPLGLLVTELVSNAIKHAFPNGRSGQVSVEFRRTSPSQILLKIEDNGIGMPVMLPEGTVGRVIVDALLIQLMGTMSVSGTDGTRIIIMLPWREKSW